MSKNKNKSLVRTARKTARKKIKMSLITELKAIAGKLAPVSKGIEKAIRKDAKSLAKKISDVLIIDGVPLAIQDEKTATAPAAKPIVSKASKSPAKTKTAAIKS